MRHVEADGVRWQCSDGEPGVPVDGDLARLQLWNDGRRRRMAKRAVPFGHIQHVHCRRRTKA